MHACVYMAIWKQLLQHLASIRTSAPTMLYTLPETLPVVPLHRSGRAGWTGVLEQPCVRLAVASARRSADTVLHFSGWMLFAGSAMNPSKKSFGQVLHADVFGGKPGFVVPEALDASLLHPAAANKFLSDDVKVALGLPLTHRPRMAVGTRSLPACRCERYNAFRSCFGYGTLGQLRLCPC